MKNFSTKSDELTALLDSLAKVIGLMGQDVNSDFEKLKAYLSSIWAEEIPHNVTKEQVRKKLKESILKDVIAIVRKEEYFLGGNSLKISGKINDKLKDQEWDLIFRGNELVIEHVKITLKNTHIEAFKKSLPYRIGEATPLDVSNK